MKYNVGQELYGEEIDGDEIKKITLREAYRAFKELVAKEKEKLEQDQEEAIIFFYDSIDI